MYISLTEKVMKLLFSILSLFWVWREWVSVGIWIMCKHLG